MSTLGYIIIFTLLGSVVSLIGGILLFIREKAVYKVAHLLASFAAGALLATAFIDLLPEAFEAAEHSGSDVNIFTWVLLGFLFFFLIERFIYWFHHHHSPEEHQKDQAVVPLIIFGDSIHNFIDGVAIAASFLVSVPLGIVTTFAVAAHEIPQEIGDFGVLLHKGLKKTKVLLINLLSSLAALVGAILTYNLGEVVEGYLPVFLAITAGFFIYIAASDLIPEIHSGERTGAAYLETLTLFLGVAAVWIAILLLEPLIAH